MSRALQNLLVPFRRDKKRDFASGTGAELIASKVRQVLLTEGATPHSTGELPWRTSFGAGLSRLRHQRNDMVLAELARVCVRDALARWLPDVQLVHVGVEQDSAGLTLHIHVRTHSTTVTVDVNHPW
ncbi:GPW/gp25 family protein [Corallococcus interemptor]|uniref:GPW/gp25 family protein n=1 Tax=Corallococcus interemptor TaxID=2316720 RepID=UPI0035D3F1C0